MISDVDKKIISFLQEDLPLQAAPYAELAGKLGISEDELLERLVAMKKEGILRRIGAVLYHNRAGFTANGMCAWQVPPEQVQEVGTVMAAFPQASHVYERPVYPDWPYNLFTMLHGQTKREVEETAAEISRRTGIQNYTILFSLREFKKASMRYY
jgi:siroheme decarboxylase